MPDVVMRTIYAGPRGVARAGDKIDLPAEEVALLVAGGYAEMATAPGPVEKRAASALPPAPGSPEPVKPAKVGRSKKPDAKGSE